MIFKYHGAHFVLFTVQYTYSRIVSKRILAINDMYEELCLY